MNKSNLSFKELQGISKLASMNCGILTNHIMIRLNEDENNIDLYMIIKDKPKKMLTNVSIQECYYFLLGLINGSQTKLYTLNEDSKRLSHA
tara:strand:- start:151 stop:423 length:273 start_codon:yes stop_codon:yes gene_type:complete